MKLVHYQLEREIEKLDDDKYVGSFLEFIASIVEDTSKPYFQRADYIGLSLLSLQDKIDLLSKDISDLQILKKSLSNALGIAKEITAEVFIRNGIDRIEGNIISSLTLTKPCSKIKSEISILDKNALIGLGFVKYDVDMEAIEKAIENEESYKEIEKYIAISSIQIDTPSKIKVNTKRVSSSNSTFMQKMVDEIIESDVA